MDLHRHLFNLDGGDWEGEFAVVFDFRLVCASFVVVALGTAELFVSSPLSTQSSSGTLSLLIGTSLNQ